MSTKQIAGLMGAKPSTAYKYLTKFTKQYNRDPIPREIGILIAQYLLRKAK